jgi:hypothetical protein
MTEIGNRLSISACCGRWAISPAAEIGPFDHSFRRPQRRTIPFKSALFPPPSGLTMAVSEPRASTPFK